MSRFARLREDLAERLHQGQADGLVRAGCDPDQVAILIIAASDGLQVQWLLGPSLPLARSLGALTPAAHPSAQSRRSARPQPNAGRSS